MVRQFTPLMRMNNKVMMTINPEPVHLTLEEIVHDLTCMVSDSRFEIDDLLMWSKKEMKERLKDIAQYRSYNYDGREYHHWDYGANEERAYEETFSRIEAKVLKVFPAFKTEEEFPQSVQEAFA